MSHLSRPPSRACSGRDEMERRIISISRREFAVIKGSSGDPSWEHKIRTLRLWSHLMPPSPPNVCWWEWLSVADEGGTRTGAPRARLTFVPLVPRQQKWFHLSGAKQSVSKPMRLPWRRWTHKTIKSSSKSKLIMQHSHLGTSGTIHRKHTERTCKVINIWCKEPWLWGGTGKQ